MGGITLRDMSEITKDYLKAFPDRAKDKADMTKIVEWLRSINDDRADSLESVLPKKLSSFPKATPAAFLISVISPLTANET